MTTERNQALGLYDRLVEAEAERALLDALFAYLPDAVIVVDERGAIVRANHRAVVLFGYTRDEMVGLAVDDLAPEMMRKAHEAHRGAFMLAPRVRPMGQGLKITGRRKDGREFPIADVALGPVYPPAGPMVIAIVRERK